MNCSSCGATNRDTAKFCGECGSKLVGLPITGAVEYTADAKGLYQLSVLFGEEVIVTRAAGNRVIVSIDGPEEFKKAVREKRSGDKWIFSAPDYFKLVRNEVVQAGYVSTRNVPGSISTRQNAQILERKPIRVVVSLPDGMGVELETTSNLDFDSQAWGGVLSLSCSGNLSAKLGVVENPDIDVRGNAEIQAHEIQGAQCTLKVKGNCNINFGRIVVQKFEVENRGNATITCRNGLVEEMCLSNRGNTTLNIIDTEIGRAQLEVVGNLRGYLSISAELVSCNVVGHNSLRCC